MSHSQSAGFNDPLPIPFVNNKLCYCRPDNHSLHASVMSCAISVTIRLDLKRLVLGPIHPSIHPLLHGLSARRCPMSPHFLTRRVSRLLGLALVSWAFARVGVHRPSLRLPYLGVFYSLFFLCTPPPTLLCIPDLELALW